MIQRIQTVFLALIVILFVVLNFVPVLGYEFMHGAMEWKVLSGIPGFLAGDAVIALLALVTIFLYKNRKRQMRICTAGMLLGILLPLGFWLISLLYTNAGEVRIIVHYGIGFWLTLANPVLFFLARRSVKKDEELVRSADRLR